MDPKKELSEEFDLDEIVKEFAPEEAPEPAEAAEETVRLDLPAKKEVSETTADTVRFEPLRSSQAEEAEEEPPRTAAPQPEKAEPYSENWEPEYEQPIGDYVPPRPILFQPRSRLRELKRKLVAGPEKRYYDLTEQGFGKLQAAIFFSILIVLLSAGATVLYALDLVPENRMKLLVFGQFFAMLCAGALGAYQLMEGVADFLKLRFTLNTLLVFTFLACFADGVLALRELRVPCCAAFSLHVTMSLLATLHRRQTELGQMDTMRRATHLDSIVAVSEYHDGCQGLLRSEGQVEDFMDNYQAPSGPEQVLNLYALLATLVSMAICVAAAVLHRSISFGVQVLSVSLLAAVPVTGFIAMTRPAAILQRRFHRLGVVLCGWQGVKGLCRRSLFPVDHSDLFPAGTCKLNGTKYYGSRDPNQVLAYCTALILADGSGLGELFVAQLSSYKDHHYTAHNYRSYEGGGIGAEVCGEPVLMGSSAFLKQMGVEVPEGIHVKQAVYASIDGELSGVFAISYGRASASAAAMNTLCGYRKLRPVLTCCDFILTEDFLKDRFGVHPRKVCLPERDVRKALAAMEPPEDAAALALVTSTGFAPFAYAVTGARSLNNACTMALAVHLVGGILGLAIMAALAVLGSASLLTPINLLLFELVWLIPGWLISEWTRIV